MCSLWGIDTGDPFTPNVLLLGAKASGKSSLLHRARDPDYPIETLAPTIFADGRHGRHGNAGRQQSIVYRMTTPTTVALPVFFESGGCGGRFVSQALEVDRVDCILLTFSVADRTTFIAVKDRLWPSVVRAYGERRSALPPILLVGNQTDRRDGSNNNNTNHMQSQGTQYVTREEGEQLAEWIRDNHPEHEHVNNGGKAELVKFAETSAWHNNVNVVATIRVATALAIRCRLEKMWAVKQSSAQHLGPRNERINYRVCQRLLAAEYCTMHPPVAWLSSDFDKCCKEQKNVIIMLLARPPNEEKTSQTENLWSQMIPVFLRHRVLQYLAVCVSTAAWYEPEWCGSGSRTMASANRETAAAAEQLLPQPFSWRLPAPWKEQGAYEDHLNVKELQGEKRRIRSRCSIT